MASAPSTRIRTLTADDLEAAWRLIALAFGDKPDEADHDAELAMLDPERMHGAFADDQLVGLIAGFVFDMTVPGGPGPAAVLPCTGTTWVAVAPTHRRRGVLRTLMTEHLQMAVGAGEPIAALWASEAAIYPRFGYGWASEHLTLTVDVRSPVRFRHDAPGAMEVRLVDLEDARAVIEPLYAAARERRPGMHSRTDGWWAANPLSTRPGQMSGMNQKLVAVASSGGQDVGYAIYGIKDAFADWRPDSTMTVKELVGVDAAADVALWRYLLDHDLVTTVVAPLRPSDDVLPLVLADPRLVGRRPMDGLYVRLVDLPEALHGRGFAAHAEATLEVRDADLSSNQGFWRLAVGPEVTEIAAVPEPRGGADLALDVRALGAAYLGATDLRSLAAAGQVEVKDQAALTALARAMRHEVAPFAPEIW